MYLDTEITKWVFENITQKYDFVGQISKYLSSFTSWGQLWILLMIILIIYEFYKKKKINLYLLISIVPIICGWAISEFCIKNLVGRDRPYIAIDELAEYIQLIGYKMSSGKSFPSGHTLIAFAAAFVLSNYNKKYLPYAYVLATLIGFSRIVLGAHYFTDVLAGVGLGTILGSLGVLFANKFSCKVNDFLNSKLKKETGENEIR